MFDYSNLIRGIRLTRLLFTHKKSRVMKEVNNNGYVTTDFARTLWFTKEEAIARLKELEEYGLEHKGSGIWKLRE